MLKALENIRAGQIAGERKKAFCFYYHRHIAILWRAASPQSLLIFILESIFFFQNISQKNHSHIVLVGMKVWCTRFSLEESKSHGSSMCGHTIILFLLSVAGGRYIAEFCCKSQLARTETAALVTWFTLCNTCRPGQHKDNSLYLQSSDTAIAHVVVCCFFGVLPLKWDNKKH